MRTLLILISVNTNRFTFTRLQTSNLLSSILILLLSFTPTVAQAVQTETWRRQEAVSITTGTDPRSVSSWTGHLHGPRAHVRWSGQLRLEVGGGHSLRLLRELMVRGGASLALYCPLCLACFHLALDVPLPLKIVNEWRLRQQRGQHLFKGD